jgi:hypothetical protein
MEDERREEALADADLRAVAAAEAWAARVMAAIDWDLILEGD